MVYETSTLPGICHGYLRFLVLFVASIQSVRSTTTQATGFGTLTMNGNISSFPEPGNKHFQAFLRKLFTLSHGTFIRS